MQLMFVCGFLFTGLDDTTALGMMIGHCGDAVRHFIRIFHSMVCHPAISDLYKRSARYRTFGNFACISPFAAAGNVLKIFCFKLNVAVFCFQIFVFHVFLLFTAACPAAYSIQIIIPLHIIYDPGMSEETSSAGVFRGTDKTVFLSFRCTACASGRPFCPAASLYPCQR